VGGGIAEFASNPEEMASPRVNAPALTLAAEGTVSFSLVPRRVIKLFYTSNMPIMLESA